MHKIDTRANVIISGWLHISQRSKPEEKTNCKHLLHSDEYEVIYTGLIGPRQATDLTVANQSSSQRYFSLSKMENHQALEFCVVIDGAISSHREISTAARESKSAPEQTRTQEEVLSPDRA